MFLWNERATLKAIVQAYFLVLLSTVVIKIKANNGSKPLLKGEEEPWEEPRLKGNTTPICPTLENHSLETSF